MASYSDRYLRIDDQGIHISWYYFPLGSKTISFSTIRSITERPVTFLTGKWRIWGGDLRRWYNYDPRRPSKETVFFFNMTRAIQPALTPDDPSAFRAALLGRVPFTA